ncbi:MAG: polyprenyl synthetase family protein [Phycisphaerales bacterium]
MIPDPSHPLPEIEAYLRSCLDDLAFPPALLDALRYALDGGKRIRPTLAWHACEAVGSPGEASLPAAAAVEFIHAFSLIHDDLPALDNDDLRRGRPTLHIRSGEALAILAGDALHALAFDILARRTPSPALAGRLVDELAAATAGMIAGQVYDTLGGLPPGLSDRERLELIHRNKTGALIRASCRMGALCASSGAGLPPACASGVPLTSGAGVLPASASGSPHLSAITRYAECVGLMFQIIDDLLDVESHHDTAGKRTGKDAAQGKLTYPSILGLKGSRAEVRRLHDEALSALRPLGPDAEGLRSLCRLLAERRK